MKNNFLKIIIVCFCGLVILNGCKKYLDTTPKNSLDLTFALSTREGLQATLVSIYDALQASGYYGRDFIVIPELLTDNSEITSNNSNRFINQANNAPNAHVNIWAAAYRNINRANLILGNIDGSQASASEKVLWKGEAYFLRALFYADLIKAYSRNPLYLNTSPAGPFDLGVPIMKTAVIDASTITFPARNTVTEVYDFIMQDLVLANSLLTNTGNGYRARRVAAQALASRVELYRGNWVQSERWADSVILGAAVPLATATTYFNLSASAPSWGNAHPETIFAINYLVGENGPGSDGIQYINYRNIPTIQGYADVTTQTSLRNDMGTTGVAGITSADQRFTKLISIQLKSGQQVFYTMKWPGLKGNGVAGLDDIMILRTSEIVLNRAEARARQGAAKEALAIADLNQTRTRAGLAAFPTSGIGTPTGAGLITEILKERRVELAFEGHRLWDILRTGSDITKSPANITLGSNPYNFLYANILQADLDVNPNLVKNPGY